MYEKMPLKARPIFGIRRPDGTLELMELEDVILDLDKRLEAIETELAALGAPQPTVAWAPVPATEGFTELTADSKAVSRPGE